MRFSTKKKMICHPVMTFVGCLLFKVKQVNWIAPAAHTLDQSHAHIYQLRAPHYYYY